MRETKSIITGIGLATPLGASAKRTWEALLSGRCIADHARVPMETHGNLSRISTIAIHAAQEAIAWSGWDTEAMASEDTAIIVGTSKGPIEAWISPSPQANHAMDASMGRLDQYGLSAVADDLGREMKFGPGPRMTLSAACASGVHAVIRAAMMIRSGSIRRALVVAAESSLHPIFVGSFRRLGVLASGGCRPFDRDRDGFLMSEAAAAICLESSITPNASDRAFAAIDRFALGADAKHLTGGDPSGSTLKRLLREVLIDPVDPPPDLVHAHGTGTILNDPMELAALDAVLGDSARNGAPYIYSHKGALGHSLGAAGMVAIVLNCLSHRHGIIPGNVQTRNPLVSRSVTIGRESERRSVRKSIAMAAGFGGPTAVIGLTSP